jgi:hypothetical protein
MCYQDVQNHKHQIFYLVYVLRDFKKIKPNI